MNKKPVTRVKMKPEELMAYLAFKKHGFFVQNKKGKAQFNKRFNKVKDELKYSLNSIAEESERISEGKGK